MGCTQSLPLQQNKAQTGGLPVRRDTESHDAVGIVGDDIEFDSKLSSVTTDDNLAMIWPLAPDASEGGVPVRWLLDEFVPAAERDIKGDLQNATTEQVVESVIKPRTASAQCAYVQLINCSAPPAFFVSHAWCRPFAELVLCLRERAKTLPEEAVVWIDIFALNQHLITYDKIWADLGTMAATVRRTQATLMVMDPEGVCFTRAWCLMELYEAAMCDDGSPDANHKLELMPFCLKAGDSEVLAKAMYNIQVERAQAKKPEDKKAILANVDMLEGGVGLFNSVIKGALMTAVAAMPALVEEGTAVHGDTLHSAGEFLWRGSDYARAGPLLEQAFELRRTVKGEEHPDTIASLHLLAILHKDQGYYRKAELMCRRAFEGRTKALGEDHPCTLATAENLADLYTEKGDCKQAELMYLQVLEGRRRALGKKHPSTLAAAENLAIVCEGKGDYVRAESMYLQALDGKWMTLGRHHPDTLRTTVNLALLYKLKGDYEQAEPLYLQALEGRRRALGEDHPDTLNVAEGLALLYESKGEYDQAETMFLQALKGRRRALGKDHPEAQRTQRLLGKMLEHSTT